MREFIKAHLADAKELADKIGHGVDARMVIAVAGRESSWGKSIPASKYGNFFGLHNRGDSNAAPFAGQKGSYITSGTAGEEGTYSPDFTTKGNGKKGSVPMAAFPPDKGFVFSGNVMAAKMIVALKGRGVVTPLEFFQVLNKNGWAEGNSAYPKDMADNYYDHLNGCA